MVSKVKDKPIKNRKAESRKERLLIIFEQSPLKFFCSLFQAVALFPEGGARMLLCE